MLEFSFSSQLLGINLTENLIRDTDHQLLLHGEGGIVTHVTVVDLHVAVLRKVPLMYVICRCITLASMKIYDLLMDLA